MRLLTSKTFLKAIHAGCCCRCTKRKIQISVVNSGLLPDPCYDYGYYLDERNYPDILRTLKLRKRPAHDEILEKCENKNNDEIRTFFEDNISALPNRLDDRWSELQTVEDAEKLTQEQLTIHTHGGKIRRKFKCMSAENLSKRFSSFFSSRHQNNQLSFVAGHGAHIFLGQVAEFQTAIIEWAWDQLTTKFNFIPITVPQIVNAEIIGACGFEPFGEHTQVYKMDGKTSVDWKERMRSKVDTPKDSNAKCLVGTSEIPLAAFHMGETLEKDQLPKKYCSISRCYRAELTSDKNDSGFYRIPYFTKLEMFAVCAPEESEKMMFQFHEIQKELYDQLNLVYRVMDMPPHELGTPATRKLDIEAWMNSRRMAREISSVSNCTDYQSRRFNIKCRSVSPNYETNEPFKEEFVHTVNGTAVALPRLLIPVMEENQQKDRTVLIPEVLRRYMDDREFITTDSKLEALFK